MTGRVFLTGTGRTPAPRSTSHSRHQAPTVCRFCERPLRSTTSPTAAIPASNAMTIPMATVPSLLAPTELVPAPSLVVLIGAERVTPPVPLLNLLDFLFA